MRAKKRAQSSEPFDTCKILFFFLLAEQRKMLFVVVVMGLFNSQRECYKSTLLYIYLYPPGGRNCAAPLYYCILRVIVLRLQNFVALNDDEIVEIYKICARWVSLYNIRINISPREREWCLSEAAALFVTHVSISLKLYIMYIYFKLFFFHFVQIIVKKKTCNGIDIKCVLCVSSLSLRSCRYLGAHITHTSCPASDYPHHIRIYICIKELLVSTYMWNVYGSS